MSESFDSLLTWVLSQAAGQSHRVLHRRLRAEGFTGYEYRVLAALAEADSLSQTELGQRASLDRSDVTATVRTLHERGLVDRRADPAHGRRAIVATTVVGSRAWESLERAMARVQDEVFGSLTVAERNELRELLTKALRGTVSKSPA